MWVGAWRDFGCVLGGEGWLMGGSEGEYGVGVSMGAVWALEVDEWVSLCG